MDNYKFNLNLTFCEGTPSPFTTRVVNIALTAQEDIINECRLSLQVNPTSYQQIETHALFNLNSEFRGPFSNGDFLPDTDIQLEITLKPDLLPQLSEHANTPETVATYLTNLSQQSPLPPNASPSDTEPQSPLSSNPLLNTENWFCLSVKQDQDSGETGYTTFWNYVNPTILNHPETAREQIAEGITNFAENWAAANLSAATEDIAEELVKGITNLFEGFETWLDNAFSEDNDNDTDDLAREKSILATIIAYFTKDDWTFTKLQGQSVLQMAYQGKNGLWNCYAQARETEEQFVFYSIYPELVSEEKRLAIAELLTRINYGLIIGNFEMDFNDGEIRYKTSIAVEGNILNYQVIKRLVYANVTIIDYYLPSIRAVMNENISPEEAIALIESDHRIS
ncbi:MAG: YbjN domain-containing protein [Okeania sp. SIO3B5]|uniref:YbjN domain-containing protein n=1 Tax=Okeania sp. SIO3B5 TaxID=2607811 RepID=UPI0013FF96CA|nr:YbjN domain-containing protein [Okeania sp. SIO3B5]NEO56924.1 YbjN domain-containing protein [Okeania sp. SIO3B5]